MVRARLERGWMLGGGVGRQVSAWDRERGCPHLLMLSLSLLSVVHPMAADCKPNCKVRSSECEKGWLVGIETEGGLVLDSPT